MATRWTGWRSRLALLASALLVPLLVAGGFVWAGWQSSDRLHHNQGVVVNLDKTVTSKGHTYTLGNQLGAQLVSLSGSQFDWDFGASAGQAAAGLASGRYSVAVVIPSNFSSALLSNGKERGVLTIQTSPLASVDQKVLAGTLAEAAQRGLARQLGTKALSGIYVTFDQVDKDLVSASQKAADANSSAVSLQALAGTATTQAATVKKQTSQVASGSSSVAAAAQQANKSAQVASKSGNAGASAAASAGTAANQNSTQASSAASGATGLNTSVTSAGTQVTGANTAASAASTAASGMSGNTTKITTAAGGAATSAAAYQKAVKAALAQQKTLSTQLATLGDSVGTYKTDVNTFSTSVQGWSKTVATGSGTGSGGTVTIDKTNLNAQLTAVEKDAANLATAASTMSSHLEAVRSSADGLSKWTKQAVPLSDKAKANPGSSTTTSSGGSLTSLQNCGNDTEDSRTYAALKAAEPTAASRGQVCQDLKFVVAQMTSQFGVTSVTKVDPGQLATDLQTILTSTTAPLPSGNTLDLTGQKFVAFYGALLMDVAGDSTTTTIITDGYGTGYADGYQAAQSDATTYVPDLSSLTTDVNSIQQDLASLGDTRKSDSDLAKLAAAIAAIPSSVTVPADGSGSGTGTTSVTVTGADVMSDAKVKAAVTALGVSGGKLDTALLTAQQTDAANQKATAGLGDSNDITTLKAQLATVLAANASEAQQIKTLTTNLKSLQTGLNTLTTTITTAQTQAQQVVQQTAATSTGASALAKQIAALQQQLATAKGSGAGTAAQAAQVATGATQLSKQASGAASAASGLSQTVGKVGTASKSVSTKTKDTATSVKKTSTTVSNTASQTAPGATATPLGTSTADQARHPNISWWTPLAAMAMWLGAMTMYMLFRPISRATRVSDAPALTLVSEVLAPGLLVALVQAFVMTVLSAQVMKLGVSDTIETFGVLALMGVAFMTANFVLTAVLGVLGRILAVIFALVTGLGVVTNALPDMFDTIRNMSPITPGLDAMRSIAAGGAGTLDVVGHLGLWAIGGVGVAALLILRSRLAEAPRVATSFA